ncbi:MAG: hypothetical protein V4671_29730, partial [Armatimonadota bacterium]
MSQSLPERPNLEHLKTQAKDLLAAYRANSPDARQRIGSLFPTANPAGLSEAQLVIAREYGFDSWAALKTQVAIRANASGLTERADQLAGAAVGGKTETVSALLASEASLCGATLSAACVTGDTKALRAFLAVDPALS